MTEKKIDVEVREKYPIFVGSGNLSSLGQKLSHRRFEKVVVVSNPRVLAQYASIVEESLEKAAVKYDILQVPEGERYKSLDEARALYDELLQLSAKRGDALVAVGGGVIGDLVGFVAATYMRGLPLVQVPTTLVAQVDSSIGGKVGVNLPQGKNLIGAFHQPQFVLVDVRTLKTLPETELRAGMAEVIKYGFLRNEEFLDFIETNLNAIYQLNEEVLIELIVGCCRIKAEIVSADEKDFGVRRILNYGHTIGHAVEALTHYERYLHGEAISIGMVCAAFIAQALGFVDETLVDRHIELLKKARLPVKLPPLDVQDVLAQVSLDKKAQGQSRLFVLLKKAGEPHIVDVAPEIIRQALINAKG